MSKMVDALRWAGISGAVDMQNVEKSAFAKAVHDSLNKNTSLKLERLRGGAASKRGPKASSWHLYNVRLPVVEVASSSSETPSSRKRQRTESDDESDSESDSVVVDPAPDDDEDRFRDGFGGADAGSNSDSDM